MRLTHRWFMWLSLLALSAHLPGCAPPIPALMPTATPGPVVRTITDSRGKAVAVPHEVKRVVSLAPSNTEILFALGLGDRVVGVTAFCDYPEAAKAITKVGDLMSVNTEQIISLAPDLVLAIEGVPVTGRLEEAGIPLLVLQPTDLESIYQTIEWVGQATDTEAAAQTLVASMKEKVKAVADKTETAAQRPKVFYELDATEPARPYTAGPGTWHDQFIRLAGGTNIAGGAAMAWVQFSAEEIIAQDPDIIILGDANFGVTSGSVRQRPGWQAIKAVQTMAIYGIDDNLISRPGPRVVEGIEGLARLIHPELFQ